MRRCNIPPTACRHRYSTPCCKDCQEADCESRCLNAPEWCGCWADKPLRKRRGHRVDTLQIAWLYGQKGLSVPEIARQLGCHKATVAAVLRDMGVMERG